MRGSAPALKAGGRDGGPAAQWAAPNGKGRVRTGEGRVRTEEGEGPPLSGSLRAGPPVAIQSEVINEKR